MPTKGLGLGFFAPLPNPVMIPMMGLQSAVMGYTFGVYFQYSKRLIGSLSNEQFNKIRANPTELSKIVQRDVGEMFSLFDPIADDTRKLQTKIVQEMIGYIKQLPQDILGGISGIDQTQFAPTPDQSYDEYVASFNSNPDTEYLHTLGIGAAGSGETMSLQEWQRRNAYLAEQNKLVTDSPKKKDESLSGEYKHYYDKIDKMSRQTLSQELARVAQGKNKFGKKKLIKDKLLQRYNFLRNQDLAKAKIYSDAKKSKKSRDEQVRKTGKSTVVTPPKETVNIEDPITFNNHVLLLLRKVSDYRSAYKSMVVKYTKVPYSYLTDGRRIKTSDYQRTRNRLLQKEKDAKQEYYKFLQRARGARNHIVKAKANSLYNKRI